MTLFKGHLPQTGRKREGERGRDRKRKRKRERERERQKKKEKEKDSERASELDAIGFARCVNGLNSICLV